MLAFVQSAQVCSSLRHYQSKSQCYVTILTRLTITFYCEKRKSNPLLPLWNQSALNEWGPRLYAGSVLAFCFYFVLSFYNVESKVGHLRERKWECVLVWVCVCACERERFWGERNKCWGLVQRCIWLWEKKLCIWVQLFPETLDKLVRRDRHFSWCFDVFYPVFIHGLMWSI